MKIKDFLDVKLLQEIQDQFSDATGLAAIAVDAEGGYITKGSNFTDFCMRYTRGSTEGLRRCVKCDQECTGTYFCHAGLMDFSVDILVNGEKLGAIIGGQVLPAEPEEEKFREIARELGVNEEEYLRALKKVPVKTEKSIRAASGMLGKVVNQLVNTEYLRKLNQKKVEVFDQEINVAQSAIKGVKSHMTDLRQRAQMENLLAINASIEAGRAGHEGVGFAVVAKELGTLAKGSEAIYAEIEKLVESMGSSIDKMNSVGL